MAKVPKPTSCHAQSNQIRFSRFHDLIGASPRGGHLPTGIAVLLTSDGRCSHVDKALDESLRIQSHDPCRARLDTCHDTTNQRCFQPHKTPESHMPTCQLVFLTMCEMDLNGTFKRFNSLLHQFKHPEFYSIRGLVAPLVSTHGRREPSGSRFPARVRGRGLGPLGLGCA